VSLGLAPPIVRHLLPLWIALSVPSVAVAAPDTSAQLKGAIEDFEFGEHAAAEKKLFPLLNPIQLASAEDVILARQYLGACYFLLDQRPKAEAEFAKILVLDAEHKLDPEVFSPALVQFFEDVRQRTGVTLRRADPSPPPSPSPSPSPSATAPPLVLTVPPPRPPLGLAFVPFGVGQFNNHQPVKGALFAVSEVGLIATAITTFVMFRGLGETNASGAFEVTDAADQSRAESLQSVFLATLYAGVGIAAIGIVEAVVSYPGDAD
jgi:hypothetical protein